MRITNSHELTRLQVVSAQHFADASQLQLGLNHGDTGVGLRHRRMMYAIAYTPGCRCFLTNSGVLQMGHVKLSVPLCCSQSLKQPR